MTFALTRNEKYDAKIRGSYRYEGFIPPGIEHILVPFPVEFPMIPFAGKQ
jgi:hypothetical protein